MEEPKEIKETKDIIEEEKPEIQTTLNTDGLDELVAEGEISNVIYN